MLLSNFTLVYIIVGFPFPRQVDLPREACNKRGITQMIINVVVGMLVAIDLFTKRLECSLEPVATTNF